MATLTILDTLDQAPGNIDAAQFPHVRRLGAQGSNGPTENHPVKRVLKSKGFLLGKKNIPWLHGDGWKQTCFDFQHLKWGLLALDLFQPWSWHPFHWIFYRWGTPMTHQSTRRTIGHFFQLFCTETVPLTRVVDFFHNLQFICAQDGLDGNGSHGSQERKAYGSQERKAWAVDEFWFGPGTSWCTRQTAFSSHSKRAGILVDENYVHCREFWCFVWFIDSSSLWYLFSHVLFVRFSELDQSVGESKLTSRKQEDRPRSWFRVVSSSLGLTSMISELQWLKHQQSFRQYHSHNKPGLCPRSKLTKSHLSISEVWLWVHFFLNCGHFRKAQLRCSLGMMTCKCRLEDWAKSKSWQFWLQFWNQNDFLFRVGEALKKIGVGESLSILWKKNQNSHWSLICLYLLNLRLDI